MLAQALDALPLPTSWEGVKSLLLGAAGLALLGAVRSILSRNTLTRVLVLAVHLLKPRLQAWVEGQPRLVAAIATAGFTPLSFVDEIGDVVERTIQGLAIEAKVEAKLAPIVAATKATKEVQAYRETASAIPVVDENGNQKETTK